LNVDTEEEVTYRIVGAEEADLSQGTISISAPLARALIGREIGDEVTVTLPVGRRKYEITNVEYV
jgi:transcription elongation factor GreA